MTGGPNQEYLLIARVTDRDSRATIELTFGLVRERGDSFTDSSHNWRVSPYTSEVRAIIHQTVYVPIPKSSSR